MTDDWPDDLPTMRKAKPAEAMAELTAKLPARAEIALAMWNEGEDLRYAWFGLTELEAVERLQNLIEHIRTGVVKTKHGPSPTKH